MLDRCQHRRNRLENQLALRANGIIDWYDAAPTDYSSEMKESKLIVEEYTSATYGDRIAGVYDDIYRTTDVTDCVNTLSELASGGRALELGIGTGRIAIPLTASGVEVHGIDSSEAMAAQLRAKEGGADIPVSIEDFADLDVDGTFTLIFVVANTFFGLTSQEDQVRCFENVASRLDERGVFLIEAFVPSVYAFAEGNNVTARPLDLDSVKLDVAVHDRMNQIVDIRTLRLSKEGIETYPVRLRYVWPSEMDLMARLAGLRLLERWADWRHSPFTSESRSHVSLYVKNDCGA